MISQNATPAELIVAYRRGPETLRDAVADLSADQLRARPIEGKMSSLEVACHIVDSDQFMCDRIKRTIATFRPLLVGNESAAYPGPLSYHERDLQLDLRLLEVQREQMATDLERLAPEAWEREAIHTENGTQSLSELVFHAVDHLESHTVAIMQKREVLLQSSP